MNNVIQFPNSDVKEYRQKCCFMNRAIQVEGEDGELQKYPVSCCTKKKQISLSFTQG